MPPVPDHFYRQSGVIAYRVEQGMLEVLLITSSKGKRWVIPKGVVEPDLTAWESAAKEAFEEAGISGEVGATPVGRYRYDKWGGQCEVEVYPLRVTLVHPIWPETYRRRQWMTTTQAAERVAEPKLRRILRQFSAG